MKQIVNKETGEVYELPEDNKELVKKEMLPLIPDEILEKYYQMQALQEQIETWQFQIKDKVKEIFKKYNIKSFKNDYIELTYVAPTTRKSVDTQKLKDAGIYEEFTNESEVKESLRVKILWQMLNYLQS